MQKYKAGDKVRYIGRLGSDGTRKRVFPMHYPPIGTIGKIVPKHAYHGMVRVQWPKATTSHDDVWAVDMTEIELVSVKKTLLERILDFFRRG